jgi:hypothetical protein
LPRFYCGPLPFREHVSGLRGQRRRAITKVNFGSLNRMGGLWSPSRTKPYRHMSPISDSVCVRLGGDVLP